MLLLPYAIFRSAHVHIGRRVVGVARFGDPDHASAALSDTFFYVLAARRRSIRVQRCSLTQTPLHPSHPLVLACWLCSCANLSLRCLARRHTVSTSIVLACVRRSCGGVADGVLMQDTIRHASLLSHSFATALFSNPIWIGCLLRPTTHLFRQRRIRCHLLPHLHMPLLSRSRMQPWCMCVKFLYVWFVVRAA